MHNLVGENASATGERLSLVGGRAVKQGQRMRRKRPTKKANKKPKSKTIYALIPKRVLVDDIILISGKGILAAGIRAGTSSDFSHVAICTRPQMLLEATRKAGVKRSSVLGTYATKAKWIKVLRPNNPLPPNECGYGVSDYAERLYGRQYSVFGAIASRFAPLRSPDDGREFCSRVIAQAYSDYGINLVPGVAPAKIFPAMLEHSPELHDVTTTCVQELDSIKDSALYDQCISISATILVDSDMQMNNRVFKSIRTRLGGDIPKNIHSLTDLWKWLIDGSAAARKADPVIYQILQTEGFANYCDIAHTERELYVVIWELVTKYAETLPISPGPDADKLVEEFSSGILLSESSLKSREITKGEYDAFIKASSLKTIRYLHGIFGRDYEFAKKAYSVHERFVKALKRTAGHI
jgi:hypothetical protein